MTDEYEPKLVALPGATLSPQVLLHRTLNKTARIKAVAVIIQWDDNSFSCDWSSMKMSELCMAEKIFALDVTRHIGGSESEMSPTDPKVA